MKKKETNEVRIWRVIDEWTDWEHPEDRDEMYDAIAAIVGDAARDGWNQGIERYRRALVGYKAKAGKSWRVTASPSMVSKAEVQRCINFAEGLKVKP